ncbi:MAG TPA: serine/threonine-protein kinase, partial [Gemmataceae bacterium]|nr:serine/threonine-protein kinase [Gemmataceae bacterium]
MNPAQDTASSYPTDIRAFLRQAPADSISEVLGLPDTPPAAGRATPGHFPVIPGYEILAELGRGGMGVVYKARQTGLNRTVALKMILGGPFADPEVRARFQAEAQAVARLQHPNIVQIFAVGTEESSLGSGFTAPYFAQEFMDGGSLEGLLAGVPHPPKEAAWLVATLARAVQHAHEAGIVHRDLKPANVLLRRTGGPPDRFPIPLSLFEPKVADFGLAKQLDCSGDARTVSGVVGTPAFMAPEQATGGARVGPGVDVHALGLILYQLLTGLQPFAGATPVETLDRVLRIDPVPPASLQPGVSRDLETVCMKCLHKQPHRRYTTALELAEDLERYLEGRPVLARPVGLPERAWRWAARRPTIAALIAAVALTATGGVAGVTAAWLHALSGWREADRLRGEAEDNRDRA